MSWHKKHIYRPEIRPQNEARTGWEICQICGIKNWNPKLKKKK
jgi:hypothetical protein